MGIPRFFRWIGERYPCLSQVVKQYQIPDFDNLYLDVNGIIHTCSHPDDDNPHFRITEEKIFADICRYIEFLFTMIKPQKVFFIAVDGVAPRAKMNQQRGRRFKSAKMAADQEAAAQKRGEKLPDTERFDSNCITPGTEFMARLDNVLNQFIQYKVSTDPNWQSVTVYYSSHSVPGEGEHKIMDFLRYQRSLPSYDPEIRHCLYGLDTDLIMLGLVSHEPHFSLLREEILFKKTAKRPTCPEQTTFYLLHLRLFREYLEFEFRDLKEQGLPFGFDIERIIDDWVLIEFLIGNDFIPHVPDCHVASNDLPELWRIYKDVLPGLGGYMNEHGRLNLLRFEKFIQSLANFDRRKFDSQYDDIKYMAGKTGGRLMPGRVRNELDEDDANDGFKLVSSNEKKLMRQLMPYYNADNDESSGEDGALEGGAMPDPPSDEEEEEDVNEVDEESAAFRAHKRDYYRSKMQLSGEKPMRTADFVRLQVAAYIEAIEWTLRYYYEGVPSWSWFYPFHYAPYLSDMTNISQLNLDFQLGQPFHPFEQLMSVLPSASRKLIPHAYRSLMTDATSSIRHFYPEDFATDLNGKQLDWEAVVLIPFIEEKQLLAAIRPLERTLTPAEAERNALGTINAFRFKGESGGTIIQSGLSFIPKYTNCAFRDNLPWGKFHLRPNQVRREYPRAALSSLAYVPNFPTFKHLPVEVQMYNAGLQVFQMPSRNMNVVVKVSDSVTPTIEAVEAVASSQIGQIVLVNWPFLTEARVISIYTPQHVFTTEEEDYSAFKLPVSELPHNPDTASVYETDINFIRRNFYQKFGLDFRQSKCIVYAVTLTGIKYSENENQKLVGVKLWSPTPMPFPYEGVIFNLKNIAVANSLLAAAPVHVMTTPLGELFPMGDTVFVVSDNYFGRMGNVIGYDERRNTVKVNIRLSKQPSFEDLIRRLQSGTAGVVYNSSQQVSRLCNCSSFFLSRITGCIRVKKQPRDGDNGEVLKVNIGLDLKHQRDNLRMPGYTYRDEQGNWLYSDQVADLVRQYRVKFPQMFKCLQDLFDSNERDPFSYKDLFPDAQPNSNDELAAVCDFLKTLPTAKMTIVPNDSFILEEQLVIEVDKFISKKPGQQQFIEMYLKPDVLYRPKLTNRVNLSTEHFGNGNGQHFNLLDRVINIAASHSVPLGLEGTIIGVLEDKSSDSAYDAKPAHEAPSKVTYEVLFDQEFQHGAVIRCPERRGYRMFPQNLLGIRRGTPAPVKQKVKNVVSEQKLVQQRQSQQVKQAEAPKNYAQALKTDKPDPSAMWKAMGGTDLEQPKNPADDSKQSWPLVPANLINQFGSGQNGKTETNNASKTESSKQQKSKKAENSGVPIPIPPRLLLNQPLEQPPKNQSVSLTSILKDIGVPNVSAPTVAAANRSANGRPAVPVFGSPAPAASKKNTSKDPTQASKSSEWESREAASLETLGFKVSTLPSPNKKTGSQKPATAGNSKQPLRERQTSTSMSSHQLLKLFNGTPEQGTPSASASGPAVGSSTATWQDDEADPIAMAKKTPHKHAPPGPVVDEAKLKMLQQDFAQLQAGKPIEFASQQMTSSSADASPLQLSPSKNPQRIDANQLLASMMPPPARPTNQQERTDYVEKLNAWARENHLQTRFEVCPIGLDSASGKNRFSSRIYFTGSKNAPIPRAFEASFVAVNEAEARRSAAKVAFTELDANWNGGKSSLAQQQFRQNSPRREIDRSSPRKGIYSAQQSSFMPTQVLKNMTSGNRANGSSALSNSSVPMLGAPAPPPSALPIPLTHPSGSFAAAPNNLVDSLTSPHSAKVRGNNYESPSTINVNSTEAKPVELSALLMVGKPASGTVQQNGQFPISVLLPANNSTNITSALEPTPPVISQSSSSPPSGTTAKPKPKLAACFGASKPAVPSN